MKFSNKEVEADDLIDGERVADRIVRLKVELWNEHLRKIKDNEHVRREVKTNIARFKARRRAN